MLDLDKSPLTLCWLQQQKQQQQQKLEDVMARCQQHLKSKSGKHNKHFINKKCQDGL
jgi:hypothetical protein